MDPIVLGIRTSCVVNAATRNDRDVRIFADIKVVIDGILEIAHGQKHRDMHALVFDVRFDDDVDPVFILFGYDLYVCSRVTGQQFSVFANIETSFGDPVKIRDCFQKFFICSVHISSPLHCASTKTAAS